MKTPVQLIQTLIILLWIAHVSSECKGQSYLEVSQSIGIQHIQNAPMYMGGGVAFIDYNQDGYEDLYFTGGTDSDKLYRNNGDGTFTDVTVISGIVGTDTVNTIGVVVGDLDNDGDKEIFVTTWEGYHNLLFENNGDGTFQDISLNAGIDDSVLSISATMGDVNKDGLLDIYVGNYVDLSIPNTNGFNYTCYANYLYINIGGNLFVESGQAYGVADTGCALAVAFTDYDGEQDMDLYLANDFGKWVLPNALYNNSFPAALYADSTITAAINDSIFGMGIAIGDYDEDGDFDYYVTNLGRNVLRQNQGNGAFLDYTDSAGVTNAYTDSTFLAVGWGTAFYDYDNDTYLDLIVSNGYIPADSSIYNTPSNPNVLFRNTGTGVFQDVSDVEGFNDSTIGRGLAIGDLNYDGAIDVIVGIADADTMSSAHALVYINQSQGNNWLKVSLQGVNTNRDAYGSQLSIFSGGRKFIREIDGGSSHLSHNSSTAHFGLGSLTLVDSIIVHWLNGANDTVMNIAVNQQIHIIEDSSFFTIHYNNLQICSSDSIFIGGTYQFLEGSYTDTLVALLGYDSIVHSSLTYKPFPADTVFSALCTGDSVFAGGTYQFTSGTYMDTITVALCDSILVTQLTVSADLFTILNATVCLGELYLGTAYLNDTILLGNYTGANGCDSTVTTNLTVLPVSATILDTSICEGDVYLGTPYFVDTTLVDSFLSFMGCDSILTTNIQVFSTDTTSANTSICEGDSINGQPVNADTTIIGFYTNADNCDSISVLTISIWPIQFSNTNLSIDWGDTLNGLILFEDTILSQTYISVNGCDSVEQFTVTVGEPLYIAEFPLDIREINCYPNPFTSSVRIEFTLNKPDFGTLVIHDLLGREIFTIYKGVYTTGKHSFFWSGESNTGQIATSGVYQCTLIASKISYSVLLILLER